MNVSTITNINVYLLTFDNLMTNVSSKIMNGVEFARTIQNIFTSHRHTTHYTQTTHDILKIQTVTTPDNSGIYLYSSVTRTFGGLKILYLMCSASSTTVY